MRPNLRVVEPYKKPIILVGTDEIRVTDDAITALATHENTFQRGGMLVQIVHEERQKDSTIQRPVRAPAIMQLREATVRERLAAAATWAETDQRSQTAKEIHPPPWVVQSVVARGQWKGIRTLEAVVETPVLRDDGTILEKPGYDASTGLFLDPTAEFLPVPESPTREMAINALYELEAVVSDFPFSSPVHRTAWLAAVLTPFVRHAFHGPAPLFLIDASTPGTGKTLLAHVTGAICAGRGMACTPKPESDEEWGKVITTIALEGDALVLIDNCTGSLGGSRLDAALTSTEWSDRILGSNSRPKLPLSALWYATGNNVAIHSDTARRTLHIRLDAGVERPENREDFAHPELLDWVRENRPRLVRACLTLLRAWVVAGRPGKVKNWGSYEAWSSIVRSALVWADRPDPYAGTDELRQSADSDASCLGMAIAAVESLHRDGLGVTTGEIVRRIRADPPVALTTFVMEGLGASAEKPPTAHKIGTLLKKYRKRIVAGKYLDQCGMTDGSPRWCVRGPP